MGSLGNKEIMARNIQYYMDLHGKTRQEMCDALGFKYSTFTDWVNGNTYPRIDKIEMMANYFGIEKSDLIEERVFAVKENSSYYLNKETEKIAQEIFENPELKILFDASRNAKPEDLLKSQVYIAPCIHEYVILFRTD